jgi:hypothetical protein
MAKAARKVLGTCTCPNCGYDKAQVREDSRGFAYIKCDECDYQGFARSRRGDEKMRAKLAPASSPAPAAGAAASEVKEVTREEPAAGDAGGADTKRKSGFFV